MINKKTFKKIANISAGMLLLISSLSAIPSALPKGAVKAETVAPKVGVASTIDTISQTPDFGTITGGGTTGNQSWTGVTSAMNFNSGTNAYQAGNMPLISGSTIGMQAVAPTIDSTGTAILGSTDNPVGTTINAAINTNQVANGNTTYGMGAVILDATVDWNSDFSMSYTVTGAGAYGSQGTGTGLMFAPLSPSNLQKFMNGGTVPLPVKGSGQTITPTSAWLQNIPINQIPNAFGMFAKGATSGVMGMFYTASTGSPVAYSASTVNMFDPSNPGQTFAWANAGTAPNYTSYFQSAYVSAAISSVATAPADFIKADYAITYSKSTRLLTITPSVNGTPSTLPSGAAGYGNLANASAIAFKTTIPQKLVGQPYSFAIAKGMTNVKGIGTGSISGTNFPNYSGQPLTTSVKLNSYSIPAQTSSLTVNYVDTNGNQIKTPTTVKANVGSTIGITNLSPNYAMDNWSYDPAMISGYSPVSATDVDVSSTAANNVMTITYKQSAVPATANFSFQYAANAYNTPAVPNTVVTNGSVGGTITDPSSSFNIPAGYTISAVSGPDGNSYGTVAAALAANPTYATATNNFVITLSPTTQTANFSFQYDNSNPNPPAVPTTVSSSGLTGSVISDPSSKFNLPAGYSVANVKAPDGNTYTTVAAALAKNSYYTTSNNFVITLTYKGALEFTSAPSALDFGENQVSNKTQNLYAKADLPVVVTDTRAADLSNWQMTVRQISPLQEVDDDGSVKSDGVSFDGYLSYNDGQNANVLTSDATLIHSENSTTAGTFNLSQNWSASSNQGIFLEAPVQMQKVGNYEGSIMWTLSIVP